LAPAFVVAAGRGDLGRECVADSAQFSTCVTELGDPQYIGTALTIQTCFGFLLTTISIELVPRFVELVGWRYAFMILAPGPLFGVCAMLRLRSLPRPQRLRRDGSRIDFVGWVLDEGKSTISFTPRLQPGERQHIR